ncbi:MAG: L-serine ammonia-lyase [Bacilli bacterium]
MDSIHNLFNIGNGPSSSHTMAPQKAAAIFLKRHPDADFFLVELFGSLALTGKGHLTDYVIKKTLGESRTKIVFNLQQSYNYHTNAMKFKAFKDDIQLEKWLVFSVGGGALKELDEPRSFSKEEVYPHKTMAEILEYCQSENINLVEYVNRYDKNIRDYLEIVYDSMDKTIAKGLIATDVLPGRLKVKRKAAAFYELYLKEKTFSKLLYTYALATAEENARGGIVVTAPTCGASGVLPAVLFACRDYHNISKEKIIDGLMIAGLFGNLIKFNASISGAEVGCQGEIGAACSMAAAAEAYFLGGNNEQIEYAAEIALEHHLGLTCDPVDGVVQIPCIERNAIAGAKAFDAANYALMTSGKHFISFDKVVEVMKETGYDLQAKYKETSTGGLATK